MANRRELVNEIAGKTGLTKKESDGAVVALTEAVTEFLSKGEHVQLIGFGTFETRHRAPREGRNPQTGESIKIEATTVPAFKGGKLLKDAVK